MHGATGHVPTGTTEHALGVERLQCFTSRRLLSCKMLVSKFIEPSNVACVSAISKHLMEAPDNLCELSRLIGSELAIGKGA